MNGKIYIIIGIIILIFCIVYALAKKCGYFIKRISKYNYENPVKIGVLLTMFVGTKDSRERKQLYMDNVYKWLAYTNFDIFTVESSGVDLGISHPRLKSYSFIQPYNNGNISLMEKSSILRASQIFDFLEYDMIFKITGKYFLPEFESMSKKIPPDSQLIIQNRHNFLQNSEIVGMRSHLLVPIISKIDFMFEKTIGSIIHDYTTYRLYTLKMDKKVARNNGSVLDSL